MPRYSQMGQTIINTCLQIVIKETEGIREMMENNKERPIYRLFKEGLYDEVILKMRPKDKKAPTKRREWGCQMLGSSSFS